MVNTDGCAEHYIYATALYLISIMSQAFSVIIYRVISSPGHGRKVVYGISAIYKQFFLQLMSTVHLLGEKVYDIKIVIHTVTHTSNVRFSVEFEKRLSTAARKHIVIDQGRYKKTGK